MIQGLIALQVQDTTIQEIVGRNESDTGYNVYPVYAPEKEVSADAAFITARITGTTPTSGRCVSTLDQVAADVVIFASDYETLDRLANASRLVLDGYKGEINGVVFSLISFRSQVDAVEESGLLARIMSYNASVRRTITSAE